MSPGENQSQGEIDALAAEWISRRDRGLTARERADFDRWKAEDPRHAEALERFQFVWSAVSRPRQTGAGDGLASAFDRLVRRRRRRRIAMVAAAAVGVIGLAFHPSLRRSLRDNPEAPTYAVVRGPERRVLSDGTVAEYPAGAVVDVDFTATQRNIHLRSGAVFFEAARDPHRPLVARAGDVEVRALGTAFLIQIDPSTIEVAVTEGQVSVKRGSQALVSAGNRIRLDRTSTKGAESADVKLFSEDEIKQRLAWRMPTIDFSDASFSEVIQLINHHSARRFVIADPSLETFRVSGRFRPSDTAAVIRMLENGFGVRVESPADGTIRLSPGP